MISLDEVVIIPSKISSIKSRQDVHVLDEEGKFPVFVSPMTCVIDDNNFDKFDNAGVIPIHPVCFKSVNYNILSFDNKWKALTFDQFQYHFNDENAKKGENYKILIDCANGHMESLYLSVIDAKNKYGDDLCVMIGNIANPLTYEECIKAGVDYVRIGIGGGSGCTTSVLTGCHASLPFILEGIKEVKSRIKCDKYPKVVADGGINSIDKIIKCLALGADYVMLGKLFALCYESCGKSIVGGKKMYYGQSSIFGQKDRFGAIKSAPEGNIQTIAPEYSLNEFISKIDASLRSAMSYCNARTLNEFIGKPMCMLQSLNEFTSYKK